MNSTTQIQRPGMSRRPRARLLGRRRRHDPMLVLNMSIFNFDTGWNRILNPIKTHENAP